VQANIEMDEGLAHLKAIIETFPADSAHWNEAQNRFQFVDRLLTECLGWERPFISVEVKDDNGGRADYLLGKPVRAALEAKKEARRFNLLPAARPEAARKLRPLVEACKVLEDACQQVITYCVFNGAQIAIVCNGPQLVIFQSSIPSMSPLDGECFVFDGFNAYIDQFPNLWRFLSPEGILENRAYREISLHRNPRVPAKAYAAIKEPNAYRYRTNFQENLRTLASVLLENIEENPDVKTDFYKECYVPLAANNRHLMLSKNIISARYKRVTDDGSAPATLAAKAVRGKIEIDKNIVSGSSSSKPVVVIGDVGVGKTSFFENLYEQLGAEEKSNTCYIHVNLGEKATLSESVKDHILNEIPSILKESYGIDIQTQKFIEKLYARDLSDFDSSVEGQLRDVSPVDYAKAKVDFLVKKRDAADAHLKLALGYIAEVLGRQVMIVIDNADQRTFATQQEAFLIAQELASIRSTLVFVALRPATFHQSKLSGALSGYQNRVLTIAPPPADEVIRRRLTFALRVAEGKTAPAALEGVKLNLSSISLFLAATLRSIKTNDQIRAFLSNITGGNTRMVIELITSFCGSPNVESERIVRIEEETGDYKVPLHEFTKHALLGEYAYYNPISSFVACNIFDVASPSKYEHFLCSVIISYLSSGLGVRDNDGFVTGAAIISECGRLGFNEDQTRSAIRRLALRRLIETAHGHYREIEIPETDIPDQLSFRTTSIGAYHIRAWAGAFSFLDAMAIDTPIFEEGIRSEVLDNADATDIRSRFVKASAFKSYLEAVWQEAAFDLNYYDFPAVLVSQGDSFLSVQRFLEHGPRGKREPRGRHVG
jgi:GTPase SAR1 family protein